MRSSSVICVIFSASLITPTLGTDGHYRCRWYTGTDNTASDTPLQPQTEQCQAGDSETLTKYANHCTQQNYVTMRACLDNGTWNCQTFLGMCKTLIRADSGPVIQPQNPGIPDHQHQITKPRQIPDCVTPTGHFTMKEMGAAVLVSFITGATMLAIVILVVWKCRNSQWEIKQRKQSENRKASRVAALHALTHIAQACGSNSSLDSESPYTFVNPNYAQVIASNAAMQDIFPEVDNEYEEIMMRKKSSCKIAGDCIYKANKSKRKSSISKIIQAFKGKESKVQVEAAYEDVNADGEDRVEVIFTRTNKTESQDVSTSDSSNGDSGFLEELYDTGKATQQITGKRRVSVVDFHDDLNTDEGKNRKFSMKF